MTKPTNSWPTLPRSPILWGSAASAGFYALIHFGVLRNPLIQRYFASHPVEYITTTMFFVGMAVLVLKIVDLIGQYEGVGEPLLPPIPAGGQPVADCRRLLASLDQLPRQRRDHYLVRRLGEALERLRRRGTAERVDDELKYLVDLDAERLYESYALFRVILWAIPILGFLGTVIGITLAVAKLAPTALEDSLQDVTAGLGVAFDTTALALALSIVLMFAKFLITRAESRLLAEVDRQADDELLGRFEVVSAGPDGQLTVVRRMAETMVQAAEGLVRRQTELWQASIDAAEQRWRKLGDAAGKQLQTALAGAMAENIKTHARQLAEAEQAAARENRQHWDRVQRALVQGAEATAALQSGVNRQAELLRSTVEATGQVARLEDTLNRNLAALAGEKNFEQTVMSLAAAINLLNARLSATPPETPSVQLDPTRKPGQAA